MEWSLAVRGELGKKLDADAKDFVRAVSIVYRRAGSLAQNAGRKHVERRTKSATLATAVRKKVYPPTGAVPDIVVTIKSSALVKRPGGMVDLLTVLEEGATVTGGAKGLLVGGRLLRKGGKRFARKQEVTIPAGIIKVREVVEPYGADLDHKVALELDRRIQKREGL